MTIQTAFKQDDQGHYITKRAGETKDYTLDYSEEMEKDEDAILTSVWSVASGVTSSAPASTTESATIWLAGGSNNDYDIVNTITTVGGRIHQKAFRLAVRN